LRHAFSPTAAAPVLASWFYQSKIASFFSPLNSVPSPGEDLWYVLYGFGARLG